MQVLFWAFSLVFEDSLKHLDDGLSLVFRDPNALIGSPIDRAPDAELAIFRERDVDSSFTDGHLLSGFRKALLEILRFFKQ